VSPGPVTVARGTAGDTHDLRRRVLRAGTPSADVTFADDDDPATVHLTARDADGRVVGIASLAPRSCPVRSSVAAVQLRGMAVEPELQGAGVGRAVLDAAVEHAHACGAAVLWANARDTAAGFYTRAGFEVAGDGFVTTDTGLPHHVVVLDLCRSG
jgi:GNAT superfamily N-acetyltransferase